MILLCLKESIKYSIDSFGTWIITVWIGFFFVFFVLDCNNKNMNEVNESSQKRINFFSLNWVRFFFFFFFLN
jgi:hypothetical protein